MRMMRLRNGSEAPDIIIAAAMTALERLAGQGLPGMLALDEMTRFCREACPPSAQSMRLLVAARLVSEEGMVHDVIRNVVLSAVEGHGLELRLGSPMGTPWPAINTKA